MANGYTVSIPDRTDYISPFLNAFLAVQDYGLRSDRLALDQEAQGRLNRAQDIKNTEAERLQSIERDYPGAAQTWIDAMNRLRARQAAPAPASPDITQDVTGLDYAGGQEGVVPSQVRLPTGIAALRPSYTSVTPTDVLGLNDPAVTRAYALLQQSAKGKDLLSGLDAAEKSARERQGYELTLGGLDAIAQGNRVNGSALFQQGQSLLGRTVDVGEVQKAADTEEGRRTLGQMSDLTKRIVAGDLSAAQEWKARVPELYAVPGIPKASLDQVTAGADAVIGKQLPAGAKDAYDVYVYARNQGRDPIVAGQIAQREYPEGWAQMPKPEEYAAALKSQETREGRPAAIIPRGGTAIIPGVQGQPDRTVYGQAPEPTENRFLASEHYADQGAKRNTPEWDQRYQDALRASAGGAAAQREPQSPIAVLADQLNVAKRVGVSADVLSGLALRAQALGRDTMGGSPTDIAAFQRDLAVAIGRAAVANPQSTAGIPVEDTRRRAAQLAGKPWTGMTLEERQQFSLYGLGQLLLEGGGGSRRAPGR